jgi:hypothetical protein
LSSFLYSSSTTRIQLVFLLVVSISTSTNGWLRIKSQCAWSLLVCCLRISQTSGCISGVTRLVLGALYIYATAELLFLQPQEGLRHLSAGSVFVVVIVISFYCVKFVRFAIAKSFDCIN